MSNQLNVLFQGICVHFSADQNSGLELPPHRVVVTHVDDEVHWPNEASSPIPVHHAQVWILTQNTSEPTIITPQGMTMSIDVEAIDSSLSSSVQCPPSLLEVWPEMELDAGIVTGREAPAVLYFDITKGALSGVTIHDSAGVQLTIETDDTEFQLVQETWGAGTETSTFPVDGTLIVVRNIGVNGESEEGKDFILSFRVATEFPPPASIASALDTMLGEVEACVALSSGVSGALGAGYPMHDIGPGCSNSHFP